METILITVHYLICLFLIIVILLQVGKGADIGAVFGGASQTVFGGRGPATFLSKMTAGVAIAFLATSIWLAQISKARSMDSVIGKANVMESAPTKAPEAVPATAQPTENKEAVPAQENKK